MRATGVAARLPPCAIFCLHLANRGMRAADTASLHRDCSVGPRGPGETHASCTALAGERLMDNLSAEVAYMASSAGQAFLMLMEPHRLMFLALGCIMGLVLGIVPGIGGLTGTAMLLPFPFTLLLGLGATTATGDPIPAVLFGVPGGAASAATVLDGYPMAKKGEAGRAL